MVNKKDKLFYDIEITPSYTCLVFIDEYDNQKTYQTPLQVNDIRNFIKDKVLIGYNNHNYDDKILYYILLGYSTKMLKQVSDKIIYDDYKPKVYLDNLTYDTMREVDVSKPSLKMIQANKGISIEETPVDFNKVQLSDDEKLSLLNYCIYDTKVTKDIYNQRYDYYFKVNKYLCDKFNLPINLSKYNRSTIITNIFNQPIKPTKEITLIPNITLPNQVVEFWYNWQEYYNSKTNKFSGEVTLNEFECEWTFGFGGVHAENKNLFHTRDVYHIDIASQYPTTMILRQSLGINTAKYKQVLEQRLEAKKSNDDITNEALKIVINSTYGLLGSEYSKLFNKVEAINVCMWGQQLLYQLSKELDQQGIRLVQVNTDGVYCIIDNDVKKKIMYDIVSNFENSYNYKFDIEYYKEMWQSSCNNYIAISEHGKIKTKGGFVNMYHSASDFKNNSLRIIHIAIVNYLVFNKSFKQTVSENPQLINYQIISKCRNTEKNQYQPVYINDNGNVENTQKINRVFATYTGGFIAKQNLKTGTNERYANVPLVTKIVNCDINNMTIHDCNIDIDLSWYEQKFKDRLKLFKGESV